MANVKRLCPTCGAANFMESEICRACGGDMKRNLPVPAGERLPVPWKEVGASLAVGAGALALRAGVHLARHLLERRAAKTLESLVSRDLPIKTQGPLWRRRQVQDPTPSRAQVRVWGRRVRRRWGHGGAGDIEVEEFHWRADSA